MNEGIQPILDNARKHFTAKRTGELQSIAIPEWQTTIYFTTPTLAEREAYIDAPNDAVLCREMVIARAMDESGEKIFSPANRQVIAQSVDSIILERIASAISEFDAQVLQSEIDLAKKR